MFFHVYNFGDSLLYFLDIYIEIYMMYFLYYNSLKNHINKVISNIPKKHYLAYMKYAYESKKNTQIHTKTL